MKKLLAIALLISMGQLCAMEAGDAAEEQWTLEGADGNQIAAVGQLVETRENTGEKVDYWLAQLASFHDNGCSNGQLRIFEVYFEGGNEVGCRAYFHESHPVAAAAFSPAPSASSPPFPAPASGRGRRLPNTKQRGQQVRRHLGTHRAHYLLAVGGGTALAVGGTLAARRHIEIRHAKGEKTVFDRMGQWIQQRYRGLVHNKKTTSETSA